MLSLQKQRSQVEMKKKSAHWQGLISVAQVVIGATQLHNDTIKS